MATRPTTPTPAARKGRRGFTLIETALTVVIVGLGIVAMCQLLTAGTMANVESTQLTTGMTIARNVRELSLRLAFLDPTSPTVFGLDSGESATNPATFDDINDLNGRTFSPPIDSRGVRMTAFPDWSQTVLVESVDPNRITAAVPNGTTVTNRVTVTIYQRTQKVCELRWHVFAPTP